MPSRAESLQAWFWSARPLLEIADALKRPLGLGAIDHDAENVYEWIEAPLPEMGTTLNLSRQHDADDPAERDRVTVILRLDQAGPSTEELEPLCQRMADTLDLDVWMGTVAYLGGEQYDYRPRQRLRPS